MKKIILTFLILFAFTFVQVSASKSPIKVQGTVNLLPDDPEPIESPWPHDPYPPKPK